MKLPAYSLLLLGLLVTSSAGCHWNRWFRRNVSEPTPIAFTAMPTRDEVLHAVNANSSRITSLQTQGATVSIPGVPSIGADIALEKPRKFRFRAGTNLLGAELDMGSNDELFWFWAQRAPRSDVFFARHDQFATSRGRQMLAVEPSWLIEALGIVEIDPASVIEGPTLAADDRVQLKTLVNSSSGQYTRLLHVHKKFAWILEQHLLDAGGQIVASARASQHEYYPLDGVSLPQKIDISAPQSQLQFQLVVDRYAINQPFADAQTLFELPRSQLQNYPFVDIADPSFVPPGASAPVSLPPLSRAPNSNSNNEAEAAVARHRGFSQQR